MLERGYTNQLQQLRNVEVRMSRDMSANAAGALLRRLQTIDDGPGTEEQKERQRAKTYQIYTFTMGREYVPVEPGPVEE